MKKTHLLLTCCAVAAAGLLVGQTAVRGDDDWLTEQPAGGKSVAATTQPDEAGEVIPLRLGDPPMVDSPCWDAKGEHLFTLTRSGLVMKVHLATLTEVARLPIAQSCTDMRMSKDGLVVAVNQAKQLWLIDPEKLAVKRKMEFAGAETVAASPGSSIAFAYRFGSRAPIVVNLTTGTVGEPATVMIPPTIKDANAIRTWNPDWKSAVLTPDGRYLIAGASGTLMRYRVQAASLILEQVSRRLGHQFADKIVLSADGEYVAVGRIGTVAGDPAPSATQIYVYKTTDFSKPVAELPTGLIACPGKDAKVIFVHDQSSEKLLAFNPQGVAERSVKTAGTRASYPAGAVLVHPAQPLVLLSMNAGGACLVRLKDQATAGGPPETGPPAIQSGAKLLGEPVTRDGLTLATVDLPAEKLTKRPAWSDDGRFLYVLQFDGMVRKIRSADFVQVCALAIGKACSWMELSGAGLVVVVDAMGELWVLDQDSFKVQRKVPVANVRQVGCSPALTVGFAKTGDRWGRLVAVDLTAGRTIRQIDTVPQGTDKAGQTKQLQLNEVTRAVVSPDGKHLFVQQGTRIDRFAVGAGGQIIYREPLLGATAISSDWTEVRVSRDSRMLLGVYFHAYLYQADNLYRPLAEMQRNIPADELFSADVDAAARRAYAINKNADFIVYDLAGTRLARHPLRDSYTTPIEIPRMFVSAQPGHPGVAGGALVSTGKSVFWVQPSAVTVAAGQASQPDERQAELDAVAGEKPMVLEKGVGQPVVRVDDAEVQRIVLDESGAARNPNLLGSIVGQIVWSDDGKQCYVLARAGAGSRLHQIAVPELVEKRRFVFRGRGLALSRCKAGVLVLLADGSARDAWLLDAATLELKRKVALQAFEPQTLAGSPASNVALAPGATGPMLRYVAMFDMESGRMLNPPPSKPDKRDYMDVKFMAVTPDGKQVVVDTEHGLVRYTLGPAGLVAGVRGPGLGYLPEPMVCLSSDGRYVARITGQKHGIPEVDPSNLPNHPKLDHPGAFIYKLDDLNKPVAHIEQPGGLTAVGFAPAARRIYAGNRDYPLITYMPNGEKIRAYGIKGLYTTVREISLQPGSSNAMIRCNNVLMYVHLPAGDGQ